MFKKRMTRRRTLEVLAARAQRAAKVFHGCLESQGLDRSSDSQLWSLGTQLAFAEWYACRLMLTSALTGDTETSLSSGLADVLSDGSVTVAEVLERYR